MRAIIADRMHSSLQEMAQLTLTMDVNMDRVVELLTTKRYRVRRTWTVPGYTDFVIAAATSPHPTPCSK